MMSLSEINIFINSLASCGNCKSVRIYLTPPTFIAASLLLGSSYLRVEFSLLCFVPLQKRNRKTTSRKHDSLSSDVTQVSSTDFFFGRFQHTKLRFVFYYHLHGTPPLGLASETHKKKRDRLGGGNMGFSQIDYCRHNNSRHRPITH